MPDVSRPIGERVYRTPDRILPVQRFEVKKEQEISKGHDIERVKTASPQTIATVSTLPAIVGVQNRSLVTVTKSKLRRDIEKILEQDLGSLFLELPLEERNIFRIKGEATAKRIEALLYNAKDKIEEIIDLIRQWLMIIPGISRYFLEQESKIKSEKILFLKRIE